MFLKGPIRVYGIMMAILVPFTLIFVCCTRYRAVNESLDHFIERIFDRKAAEVVENRIGPLDDDTACDSIASVESEMRNGALELTDNNM